MSFNKEDYWRERLDKAKNPKHISYYRNKLKGLTTHGRCKAVYSEKLDKCWGSYSEAARELGVSRNYVYKVLTGQIVNKFKIRDWN